MSHNPHLGTGWAHTPEKVHEIDIGVILTYFRVRRDQFQVCGTQYIGQCTLGEVSRVAEAA
jgi:hypothetical protein